MKTLVAVQCYSGDVLRVEQQLEQYTHHGFQVILLAPEDAPATLSTTPLGVGYRLAGKNAYNDVDSHQRYKAQLTALLEYDTEWYLLNESDSFCLQPELPNWLYEDPEYVWSNELDIRGHVSSVSQWRPGFDEPDVEGAIFRHNPVMQAPWFFSHEALERMVAVHDEAYEALPSYAKYIDWWWHTASHMAGLVHRGYEEDGVSMPITSYDVEPGRQAVLNGAIFIHAVKDDVALNGMLSAYKERTA